MFSRRLFLLQVLFLLISCQEGETPKLSKLTMGVVSYDEGNLSFDQYSVLRDYLETQLKTIVELEPVYNEVRAIEQIRQRNWSLVFAPPGLAAIAISEEQYLPLFPLEGLNRIRSVIVLRQESSIKQLSDLAGQVIALGQTGSATGYYLPLYHLYGLTLAEIRLAPTPKTILQWIDQGEVIAGAMSLAELERYREDFNQTKFRVLYADASNVPRGSILVGSMVERNQQEQIRKALASASPAIAAATGYLPNAQLPDYSYLIKVVEKVRPISQRIKEKPAPLY